MYSGGFYPYKTLEKHWGYWCRYIYINRYTDAPKPVYQNLHDLVKEKDYFVLTTNVDHCFQKAGFDKSRIFYTQGDYGLFQCSEPCHKETYDNEEAIKKMVLSQGFQMKDGELQKPENGEIKLTVPTGLIPYCPHCGKPMSMNLRSDQTFVEDDGWHQAAERYEKFIQEHKKNVANLIGTPLTLTFVSRNSNKKGCYPCKKSIVDDSTIYTINEFNEKMGDYHVLSFKLNFTGITEELHFASRASKLYLNDLKQVNTTWMINAYVGKKSYGCNVLKEELSILNVYYVTPKEAKSIYKSKNLTLTKILMK